MGSGYASCSREEAAATWRGNIAATSSARLVDRMVGVNNGDVEASA